MDEPDGQKEPYRAEANSAHNYRQIIGNYRQRLLDLNDSLEDLQEEPLGAKAVARSPRSRQFSYKEETRKRVQFADQSDSNSPATGSSSDMSDANACVRMAEKIYGQLVQATSQAAHLEHRVDTRLPYPESLQAVDSMYTEHMNCRLRIAGLLERMQSAKMLWESSVQELPPEEQDAETQGLARVLPDTWDNIAAGSKSDLGHLDDRLSQLAQAKEDIKENHRQEEFHKSGGQFYGKVEQGAQAAPLAKPIGMQASASSCTVTTTTQAPILGTYGIASNVSNWFGNTNPGSTSAFVPYGNSLAPIQPLLTSPMLHTVQTLPAVTNAQNQRAAVNVSIPNSTYGAGQPQPATNGKFPAPMGGFQAPSTGVTGNTNTGGFQAPSTGINVTATPANACSGGPTQVSGQPFMNVPSMGPCGVPFVIQQVTQPQLPGLKLPFFAGEVTKFSAFIDSFKASVDSQPIRDIQKLQYLLSYLKGEAKEAVERLAITDDNYKIAVATLYRRFGQPTMVVQALLAEMERIPTPKDGAKISDYRRVFEQIEGILLQLANLNQPLNDIHTAMLVERKMPYWLQSDILRNKEQHPGWTLNNTRWLIDSSLRHKEQLEIWRSMQYPRKTVSEEAKPKNVHATTAEATQSAARKCKFCAKDHWSNQCTDYPDVPSRRAYIQDNNLCFRCFGKGHRSKECKTKVYCYRCSKDGHNQALCTAPKKASSEKMSAEKSGGRISEPLRNNKKPGKAPKRNVHACIANDDANSEEEFSDEKPDEEQGSESSDTCLDVNLHAVASDKSKNTLNEAVFLLTAKTEVSNAENPERAIECDIFLDPGSDVCLITGQLAKDLGLKAVDKQVLSLNTVQSEERKRVTSNLYQIGIKEQNGHIRVVHVFAVDNLVDILPRLQPTQNPVRQRTQSVHFRKGQSLPQVLIGANYAWEFMTSIGKKLPQGVYPIETTLGTLYSGTLSDEKRVTCAALSTAKPFDFEKAGEEECQLEFEEDVRKLWTLESLGIHDRPNEDDDQVAFNLFMQSLQRIDGRYYGGWPLKTADPKAPSNYTLCVGRLISVWKRLSQEPELLRKYHATFMEQLNLGIIEVVEDPAKAESPLVMYLPHHAVIREDKISSKVRIVFDCSAKSKKSAPSFNDLVFRGPVLLVDLCSILLRIRLYIIIILADLVKAFLQIGLNLQSAEMTRFLWLLDPTKPPTPSNIVVYRYRRVLFGNKASPFMLACCLQAHFKNYDTELAKELATDLYVDNVCLNAETTAEALQKCAKAKELFAEAKMTLSQFVSNDPDVQAAYGDSPNQTPVKMLGIEWCPKTDMFSIGLPKVPNDKPITKRFMLKFVAKKFDPAGWTAPVTLAAKILIQDCWKNKEMGWDDEVPESIQQEWCRITEDWGSLKMQFARKICANKGDVGELIIFVDASQKAYACCAYVRIQRKEGYETDLLMAKTRLRPVKQTTIPRMELLACLIGARLAKFLLKELPLQVSKVTLFSDSKAVLAWLIAGTNEKSRFILNRITEINNAPVDAFKYVNTKENPADIASRTCTLAELDQSELWRKGPVWLRNSEDLWPVQPHIADPKADSKAFDEENPDETMACCHATTAAESTDLLFKLERHSEWKRAVRSTAYVFKFLKNTLVSNAADRPLSSLLTKIRSLPDEQNVTALDYALAERVLIIRAQNVYPPTAEEKTEMGIHLAEDGLLRCKTRMGESELPISAQVPIWLPSKQRITSLIVLDLHERMSHAEVRHVANELRMTYFFSRMHQRVKSILFQECYECKRRKCKPFCRPTMPDLPKERVTKSRAFDCCGTDLFGPVMVRNDRGEMVKRWGCIFVCAATRAIHLEPLTAPSADEFLSAFARFISRRGRPRVLISDHGSNLKASDKHLADMWQTVAKDEKTRGYLAHEKVEWRFITQRAAFQGGFYEKLVDLTKKAIKGAAGRKVITQAQWDTYLPQAECLVNTRPLVGITGHDTLALRPVDLLGQPGAPGFPSIVDDILQDPSYRPSFVYLREDAINHFRVTLELSERFWERWHKEYLAALREKHSLKHRDSRMARPREPNIGEICLIHDDDAPKGQWHLGKVVSFVPSRDNSVRAANLQVAEGKTLTRAVSWLYPLELRESSSLEDATEGVQPDEATQEATAELTEELQQPTEARPQRKSKQRAIEWFKTIAAISTRQVMSVPFLILGLLCLLSPSAAAQKCPSTAYNLQRVASPICRSYGLGIYQLTSGQYCHADIYCRAGHIRPLNESKECGETCKCDPAWVYCSFYEGKAARNSSSQRGKIRRGFEKEAPEIFSPTLVAHGSENSVYRLVPQVRLYDGTSFYVNTLKLVEKEVLNDHARCLGKGNLKNGTPFYCAHNPCFANATKFCYYDHATVTMYRLPIGDVAIREWAVRNVSVRSEEQAGTSKNPESARVECTKEGITYSANSTFDAIEICEPNACHRRVNVSLTESFPFAKSTKVTKHEVTGNVWLKGRIVAKLATECPAIVFCEEIRCWFCLQLMTNPSCIPSGAVIVFTALIYVASVVTIALANALFMICRASRTILSACHVVLRVFQAIACTLMRLLRRFLRPRRPRTEEQAPLVRWSAKRRWEPIVFVAVVFVLVPSASACGDARTLVGSEKLCVTDDSGLIKCTFDESVQLALQPQAEACLLLADPGSRPAGAARFSTEAIFNRCHKRTTFHTQPFELQTESVKRCFNAGPTCYANKCAKMNLTDKPEELVHSNSFPGHTYCTGSCGTIFCGCWHAKDGCLIYRVFAVPTRNASYEVFECKSWDPVIRVRADLEMGGDRISHTFELNPGDSEEWNNVRVTLTSMTQGQALALGQVMITDGKRVGIPMTELRETLTCEPGNENDFNKCKFPESLCHCREVHETAACTCHQNVSYSLDDSSILPQFVGGIWFEQDKGTVIAKLPATVATVQVTLKGLTTQSEVEANTCTISDTTVEGCYACDTAAVANVTCKTDFGTALSHVTCEDNVRFSVKCTPEGNTEIIRLMFTHSEISERCKVKGPASETHFIMKGRLHYVGESASQSESMTASEKWVPAADYQGIWRTVFGLITAASFIWEALGTLVVCILVTVLLYLGITIYCPCLMILWRTLRPKAHVLVIAVIGTMVQKTSAMERFSDYPSWDAKPLVITTALISSLLITLWQFWPVKTTQIMREKEESILNWMQDFSEAVESPRDATLGLTDFVDMPEVLGSLKRMRKRRQQLMRRLKRKEKRSHRDHIRKHREIHCCLKRRCRIGWTCKGEHCTTTSDEDSDYEWQDDLKPCYCVRCYQGNESHIKGGTWFGLYLAIVVTLAVASHSGVAAERSFNTSALLTSRTINESVSRGFPEMFGIGGPSKHTVAAIAGATRPAEKKVEWIPLIDLARERFGHENNLELINWLQTEANRSLLFAWMQDKHLSAGPKKPLGRPTEIKEPADKERSSNIPMLTVAEHFAAKDQPLEFAKLPVVMCPMHPRRDPTQVPMQMPLEKFKVGIRDGDARQGPTGTADKLAPTPLAAPNGQPPESRVNETANPMHAVLCELIRMQKMVKELPEVLYERFENNATVQNGSEEEIAELKQKVGQLQSDNVRMANDLARIRAERETLRSKNQELQQYQSHYVSRYMDETKDVQSQGLHVGEELLNNAVTEAKTTKGLPNVSLLENVLTTEGEDEDVILGVPALEKSDGEKTEKEDVSESLTDVLKNLSAPTPSPIRRSRTGTVADALKNMRKRQTSDQTDEPSAKRLPK